MGRGIYGLAWLFRPTINGSRFTNVVQETGELRSNLQALACIFPFRWKRLASTFPSRRAEAVGTLCFQLTASLP